jgi:uncharacterized protein (TIGR01777 family)
MESPQRVAPAPAGLPTASRPHFGPAPESVLVTGATGFIGRILVAALIADGHRVLVLSRQPQRASRLFGPGVACHATLEAIAPGEAVDVVINLAGARILGLPWTDRRKQALLASRAGLTRNLVDWMGRRAQRPRLLLSASAVGYYGVQPQGDDTLLTEDSPPQPVFMSALCQQWERAAAQAAGLGVRVVCFRMGLVLGHGGALPPLLLPVRLGLGGRLGTGRQWYSWIHVADVVSALAWLWRAEGGTGVQAVNFTAPQAMHQLDFTRAAAQVLGRPCWLAMPGWPMRLGLGEQADLLLEGQRVHPRALLQQGFTFRFATLESALRDLCVPVAAAA